MSINPPAWTLAVELGFYLFAPHILKSEKKTFIFVLPVSGYLLSINYVHFPLYLAGILGRSILLLSTIILSFIIYIFWWSSTWLPLMEKEEAIAKLFYRYPCFSFVFVHADNNAILAFTDHLPGSACPF